MKRYDDIKKKNSFDEYVEELKSKSDLFKQEPKLKHKWLKIKESSLSRIWSQVTQHDSGTISACRIADGCRGKGNRLSKRDNKKRTAGLHSQLLSLGYGVTPIRGVYIENYGTPDAEKVREDSFIVVDLKDKGTLKKDLVKLGTKWNQDSITFSKVNGDYYLISTNRCKVFPGWGRIGVEEKLGKSFFGKEGEFHSSIRNRPFVFESVNRDEVMKLTDFYPTEIRSIKMTAKKYFEEDERDNGCMDGECDI